MYSGGGNLALVLEDVVVGRLVSDDVEFTAVYEEVDEYW